VLLSVLGAVALVACVVSAAAVVVGGSWLRSALTSPTSTVQDFYGALQQRNYASAYKLFSSSAQAHLSESAFADQFGAYDTIDGPVTQVSIGAPQYKSTGAEATVAVNVTRSGSGTRRRVDQLMLIKELGGWRITSISLQFGAPPTATGSQ
jgi:hypothetical protein